MRIIIIEDEPLMAEALEEAIILVDSRVEILAKLSSIESSVEYFQDHELPDLFFSDIELSDGLSFELFKKLKCAVPIIFCTAYDHYALEAFNVCGIDYILKPFDEKDIQQTLTKYNQLFESEGAYMPYFNQFIKTLEAQTNKVPQNILVHKGGQIIPVKVDEIALLALKDGIVFLYTFSKGKMMVQMTMDKLQHTLGDNFFRVNRQYLIHRKNVSHANQYFARKLMIHPKVAFEENLVVSKANASKFLKWLAS